jgi:hypothetical protein
MVRKWNLPHITIDDNHVFYNVDINTINLGMSDWGWADIEHKDAPDATIEEMYTACLIHETTHWAQMQPLATAEKKKVNKVQSHTAPTKSIVERHAVEIETDWLDTIGKLKKRGRK